MVTVKAKETVAHGPHFVRKGELAEMSEATAKDLEKVGLVEIHQEKAAAVPENKMAPDHSNKGEPARKPRNKAK